MTGFAGKLNIYTCEDCRGHIVTRDVDEGVTPFMTNCRSTPGCKGFMKSSMYRVFDQSMAESHQWYRPDPETWPTYPEHTQDHLRNGGLILRETGEPEPYVKPEPFGLGKAVARAREAAKSDERKARIEAEIANLNRQLSRQERRAAERQAQKSRRKGARP